MSVEIHISADNAEQARHELAKLLGPAVPMWDAPAGDSVKHVVAELNATDTAIRPAPEPAVEQPAVAGDEPKKRGRKPKTETATPQISTGEARVGPEDDPTTAEQDAADEAAEVEANRSTVEPLTHDDVRAAVTDYIAKYGAAVASADITAVYLQVLGPVPPGTKNKDGKVVDRWATSAIPNDQVKLAACIAAIQDAVKTNPFARATVEAK